MVALVSALAEQAVHQYNAHTKRAYCYYNYYGSYTCSNSGWYNWGRWVLLGVVLFVFFVLFVGCTCVSRRRARKAQKPFYGTGWMAHGVEPAPPYTQGGYNGPVNNNYTGNSNAGYYGQQGMQENGYAPQKPAPAYQNNPANGSYAPPQGPPPQHYR